jgi:NAD(P)-dependent dehydrogenase (short-subunit alcohol dehydrogenase family)
MIDGMKGKAVFISGAGGGLGRALVAAFVQEGAGLSAGNKPFIDSILGGA